MLLFLVLVMLLVLCFVALFYPFRSVIPPKRSRRARTPSSRATEVAATAEPPRKKSRQLATSMPDDAGAQMIASSATSAVGQVPVQQPPTLSADVMDSLVSRVVLEVTRRLSPGETDVSTSRMLQATSAALSSSPEPQAPLEVSASTTVASASMVPSSVMELPVVDAASVQVPNAVAAGDLPGAIVRGPLITAQSSLSGERPCLTPELPSQLFTSPSLAINSRVSDKLKAKICGVSIGDFMTKISVF